MIDIIYQEIKQIKDPIIHVLSLINEKINEIQDIIKYYQIINK